MKGKQGLIKYFLLAAVLYVIAAAEPRTAIAHEIPASFHDTLKIKKTIDTLKNGAGCNIPLEEIDYSKDPEPFMKK
jgi:hypothetical protein